MEQYAIIGCALRTPGAANADEFWRLLIEGRSSIATIPEARWNARELMRYRSDIQRVDSLLWGSFINGIDLFEPSFFNVGEKEAQTMDPQQRLVMEVGYQCIEHAGLTLSKLHNSRTGVYVGISSYDYNRLMGRDYRRIDANAAIGTSLFAAPNRLSWFLKLKGPSVAIDAACASSFVALHQACRSLGCGETDLALVGGVNAILTPDVMISFAQTGLLSQDGHCRSFDSRADGYVRAEACGMVALKRLSDAKADADRILGVIRGVALSQTGIRSSFAAPNGVAQEEVMQEAWKAAGVTAGDLGYIEAHATGTVLGDAVELGAIHALMQRAKVEKPCGVGSYKPNLGYPESASGIVSLIKALKIFEHGRIPGQIDLEQGNPALRVAENTVRIAREAQAWHSGVKRIAGLNAFGVGGTYAHVVIEEPEPASLRPNSNALFLLPLSAKRKTSLKALARDYYASLDETNPDLALELCRACATRGNHFRERYAVYATDVRGLRAELMLAMQTEVDTPAPVARKRPIYLKFSGPIGPCPALLRVESTRHLLPPEVTGILGFGKPAASESAAAVDPYFSGQILALALLRGLSAWGMPITAIDFLDEWSGVSGAFASDAGKNLIERAETALPPACSAHTAVQDAIELTFNLDSARHRNTEFSLLRWLYETAAIAYRKGAHVNWSQLWSNSSMSRQILPPYAFDRQRYWIEEPAADAIGSGTLHAKTEYV